MITLTLTLCDNWMMTAVNQPGEPQGHYMHYSLYLDAPLDNTRLEKIKILKIRENLPLTDKLLKYIETAQIRYLEFGIEFNYPINNLPACVEHIFFHPASRFNRPLVNLPSNLKTLILGGGYWETMEYLPCSLLFLGYHKSKKYFSEKYLYSEYDNNMMLNLDDIINTNLPNLLYISLPCDIIKNIDFSTSRYKKKIQKASSSLFNNFIELIEDRYNLDYFMVHG